MQTTQINPEVFNLDNLICKRIYTNGIGWHDCFIELNPEQVQSFVELLGGRAQSRNTMTKAAKDNFSRLPSFGIFKRLEFNGNKAEYTAGQDYPGEITYIRNLIKKYY